MKAGQENSKHFSRVHPPNFQIDMKWKTIEFSFPTDIIDSIVATYVAALTTSTFYRIIVFLTMAKTDASDDDNLMLVRQL